MDIEGILFYLLLFVAVILSYLVATFLGKKKLLFTGIAGIFTIFYITLFSYFNILIGPEDDLGNLLILLTQSILIKKGLPVVIVLLILGIGLDIFRRYASKKK